MKENDFADILWKYFELHSNQRMQMMNFYLIIESLFVTGFITLAANSEDLTFYKLGICAAIIFFSWIFYKLDLRTRNMIKRCEKSLMKIEDEYRQFGEEIMIFTQDEKETSQNKELTYSKILKIQYLFFTLMGLICIILVIMQKVCAVG